MRGADSAVGQLLALVQGRLLETVKGGALFGINVEDGVELCELEQVVHFFCKVQEFQFAAAAFDSCVGADEFPDARAVDVIHVRKI